MILVYLCYHTTSHIALDIISDIQSYDQDGMTALHYADQNRHIEVLQLLLDRHANIEAVTEVSQTVSIASTYCIS